MLGNIDALTRRRLGGAVLVLAGVAVAAAVLLPRIVGGDAPKVRESDLRIVAVPPLGLSFAHPRSWTRRIRGKAIRLRSADGSMIMTLTSPVDDGRAPSQVKGVLKRALLRRLAPAKVLRDGQARVGAHRVPSFELVGVGGGGRAAVRALGLVPSTRYRTYALTLVTALRPSRRAANDARRILASVRLYKPIAVKR